MYVICLYLHFFVVLTIIRDCVERLLCMVAFTFTAIFLVCIVTHLQSGLNLQPPDDFLLRSLEASNNTGILNTCIWLWLMVSEQATPVDSIKDVV